MIDLHAHVLPGIDDGPATLEDALALARSFERWGTTTVVATPHVSWDHQQNSSASVAAAVQAFNRELERVDIDVTVLPGAEVALTRATDLPPEELVRLQLGDGPWLLLECPLASGGNGIEAAATSLMRRGHEVLLAHPERVTGFQRDPGLLDRLVGGGALCQLTAGSLTGRFGRTVQRFSHGLLDRGLVHVLASDAHSVDRRPPMSRDDLRAQGLSDALIAWATTEVPRALLAGTDLPERPAAPASRGRVRLLKRRLR